MQLNRNRQFSIWYALVALMILESAHSYPGGHRETLRHCDFKKLLTGGQLEAVSIGVTDVRGTVRTDGPGGLLSQERIEALRLSGQARWAFATTRVDDPSLATDLEAAGVSCEGRVENGWLQSLRSMVIWIAVFFGIWTFAMRRTHGAGGMMAVGKSKARVYVEKDTRVTFTDVAGVDEANKELEEVVSFLREPDSYRRVGARIPKGILRVGPPGARKMLLASAITGEAGVPFFFTSGSESVEMFVGVGAARVRDLFERARQQAPAIVFIDDLASCERISRAAWSRPVLSWQARELVG